MLRAADADTMNAVDDRELVERLRHDDKSALDLLFRQHARAVFAFSYSQTRNRADAEDILQDTFVTLWERRHVIVLHTESAVPWLLATARHKSLNLARKRTRHRHADLLDVDGATPDDTTAAAAELALTIEVVDQVIAQLPEMDRLVFALCVDGDQSYADAARDLGISHAALRGRISRLRARLRDEIELLRGR